MIPRLRSWKQQCPPKCWYVYQWTRHHNPDDFCQIDHDVFVQAPDYITSKQHVCFPQNSLHWSSTTKPRQNFKKIATPLYIVCSPHPPPGVFLTISIITTAIYQYYVATICCLGNTSGLVVSTLFGRFLNSSWVLPENKNLLVISEYSNPWQPVTLKTNV